MFMYMQHEQHSNIGKDCGIKVTKCSICENNCGTKTLTHYRIIKAAWIQLLTGRILNLQKIFLKATTEESEQQSNWNHIHAHFLALYQYHLRTQYLDADIRQS